MQSNKSISDAIIHLITGVEKCSDNCACLVCFIKDNMCICNINLGINKCRKCGVRLCSDCDNIANNYVYCTDCFSYEF